MYYAYDSESRCVYVNVFTPGALQSSSNNCMTGCCGASESGVHAWPQSLNILKHAKAVKPESPNALNPLLDQ